MVVVVVVVVTKNETNAVKCLSEAKIELIDKQHFPGSFN